MTGSDHKKQGLKSKLRVFSSTSHLRDLVRSHGAQGAAPTGRRPPSPPPPPVPSLPPDVVLPAHRGRGSNASQQQQQPGNDYSYLLKPSRPTHEHSLSNSSARQRDLLSVKDALSGPLSHQISARESVASMDTGVVRQASTNQLHSTRSKQSMSSMGNGADGIRGQLEWQQVVPAGTRAWQLGQAGGDSREPVPAGHEFLRYWRVCRYDQGAAALGDLVAEHSGIGVPRTAGGRRQPR
ncbi:hypothetical protein DL89DRAFT_27346 [Linderina pennispora]|uniref:Uncharacterized protein n=1 Tax=Linderina pennispora TaxID=61395 RepID=A0A1Y1W3N8_9FUNG|nr:uncharacterized protein DL89DRAFT_27346 [Linderina pennispora]ORX68150.1 hypothetical protein DL89DRAFT_27346 [Linderina pennispora]